MQKNLLRQVCLLMFAIAGMIPFVSKGQTAAQYGFAASTATFTPITGGTAVATILADDAESTSIPIGFTFSYGGNTYTTVSAGSNGYLKFNNTVSGAGDMRNNSFTMAAAANMHPVLGFLWDDLDGRPTYLDASTPPSAAYVVTGTPGSQVFTFEWLNYVGYTGTLGVMAQFSAQVSLYEATGNIEFNYRKEAGTGLPPGASIGISTGSGVYLALNNSSASPAASSSTNTTNITSYPATDQRYTFIPPTICLGTPNAGTVSAPASFCANQNLTLSLAGSTVATGLTWQWEESPSGANTWSPIASATTATSVAVYPAVATDYRCIVTCTALSLADTTPTYTVTQNPFLTCYCTSAATYTGDGDIWNVTFGQLNNTTNCTQTGGTGSILSRYSDYTTVIAADTIYQDAPYPVSVMGGSCSAYSYDGWAKIFIDLDHDGLFTGSGEEVFSSALAGGQYTPSGAVAQGVVNIPSASSMLGLTRMRVIMQQANNATPVTPCTAPNYYYGETEDYYVYIPGPAATCGTVTAGSITTTKDSACIAETFTLVSTGYSSGQLGLTYQWEESPAGANTWNPITNATAISYTGSLAIPGDMDYRFTAICNSGTPVASNVITVRQNPIFYCYCSPLIGNTLIQYPGGNYISYVQIPGTTLANVSTTGGPGGYTRYKTNTATQTAAITQGVPYVLNVAAVNSGSVIEAWIDYDQSGTFDASEYQVFQGNPTTTYPDTVMANIMIPHTSMLGNIGMRIRQVYNVPLGSANACIMTNNGYEVEDYILTVSAAPACSGVPNVPAVTIQSGACLGEVFTLSATGVSTGSGITYQWEESPAGTNSFTPITNATLPYFYAATQTADMDYRFVTTCPAGGTTYSDTLTVIMNPFQVCYCSPKTVNTLHNYANNYITRVRVVGTTLDNASSAPGAGSYTQYYPSVLTQTGDVSQGVSYNFLVNNQYTGTYYGADVWIDLDQSGTFDASEYFSLGQGNASGTTDSMYTIPLGGPTGVTGMRVRAWGSTGYGASNACLNYGNGYETEDYVLNILAAPSCVPPTALSAGNITATTADISWTSQSATLSQIEYAQGSSFVVGTGTRVTSGVNPTTISSLNPSSTYSYYVRDICGPGDTSTWTPGTPFVTLCVPITSYPWTDDVESQNANTNSVMVACWSSAPTSTFAYAWNVTGNGTTPSSPTGASAAHSGSKYFFTEASNGGTAGVTTAELISPQFDLTSLTSPQVEFYYHMAGTDINRVVVQVYSGSVWTPLDSIVGQQQTAETDPWQKRTVSLAGYSGVVQVRFVGVYGGSFLGDICIDDITVMEAPSCPAPTAMTATNATTTSVDLGWTSAATQFQISYAQGLTFTPNNGTKVNVTNPHTLNLAIPAVYSYFVRSICGPGDTSGWSSRMMFAPLPPNDDCSNAIDITNGVDTAGYNIGGVQSQAPCATGTTNAYDVWYTFTTGATAGNVTVTVNSTNTGFDAIMETFVGSCGSLVTQTATSAGTSSSFTCIDGPAAGVETGTYAVLANTTYYVRVYGYQTTPTGAFSIQVLGSPLAIKLGKLTATNVGASNRVEWNTLSEEATDKFELQRSADGNNFSTIANIDAKGQAHRYTYMDNAPVSGYNYYRLLMKEVNGQVAYSQIAKAFVKTAGFSVEAYPNPVSQNLTVRVSGVQGGDATVQVTDVTGKIVKTIMMTGSEETINMSGLANGIYLIKYSDTNHTQTIRVNKQ